MSGWCVRLLHLAALLSPLKAFVPCRFVDPTIRWRVQKWTSSHLSSNVSAIDPETTVVVEPPSHPPPPNSTNNPSDDVFRAFRTKAPKWLQYALRDRGVLRWVVDTSTMLVAAPTVARQYHPYALLQLLQLSLGREQTLMRWCFDRWLRPWLERFAEKKEPIPLFQRRNTSFEELSYGPDRRQVIHLLCHEDDAAARSNDALVVFVHGGAWGSGFPALYRLAATPFLDAHMNVAMVGYRTYPTAVVSEQISDVRDALSRLTDRHRTMTTPASTVVAPLRVILVGHSSGAHLCALGLLQGRLLDQNMSCAGFVGICGVYDIAAHYRFESGRGVERISPMAPACGGGLANWRRQSPTWLAAAPEVVSTMTSDNHLANWPPTLLCHGVLDSTVPYSSSVEFFAKIASTNAWNRLEILPDTEHAETALHLMFGGTTRDTVMSWIRRLPR